MKYIIDTDPGIDDAMALMLAIKSGLNIEAVTAVAGNSSVENTAKNARYILDILGKKEIPVYAGSKKPLKRELTTAFVHGKNGLEGIKLNKKLYFSGNAVERILSAAKQQKQISIISLGPLTNIAKAILSDPKTMLKIKEIIMMAGALRVPGNKNRVAEFNVFVDPEAADIVFNFPVKKTIIPLDACNNVKMTLNDFYKIKGVLKPVLLNIAEKYIKNLTKHDNINSAVMYDPLVPYYIINPGACVVRKYDIKVETKGELTRGMTVADLRNNNNKNMQINVVEKVDSRKFKRDFIKYLSK